MPATNFVQITRDCSVDNVSTCVTAKQSRVSLSKKVTWKRGVCSLSQQLAGRLYLSLEHRQGACRTTIQPSPKLTFLQEHLSPTQIVLSYWQNRAGGKTNKHLQRNSKGRKRWSHGSEFRLKRAKTQDDGDVPAWETRAASQALELSVAQLTGRKILGQAPG